MPGVAKRLSFVLTASGDLFPTRRTQVLKEFREFAMRGNVVDLAVGVIIGVAFEAVVTSLVNDLIMPIIGAITGGLGFSHYFLPLSKPLKATPPPNPQHPAASRPCCTSP